MKSKLKSLTEQERLLLPKLNQYVHKDSRLPQADITNAGYLFGDTFDDTEYADTDGDLDFDDVYDDIEDGDVLDTGTLFKMLSGDTEYGDAKRKKKFLAKHPKMKNFLSSFQRKNARGGIIGANQLPKSTWDMTIPFISMRGGTINQTPIGITSHYLANDLKVMLDRMASDYPYQQDTGIGTVVGGNWNVKSVGEVVQKFFCPIILKIGINQLAGVPATPVKVWGNIPTIAGVLTILEANPIVFTINRTYEVDITLYPWKIVANIPCPVLGTFTNLAPNVIDLNVAGIPTTAQAAVSLITPGTIHQNIIALRKTLRKGR